MHGAQVFLAHLDRLLRVRVPSGRMISQRQFRWFYWMRNISTPLLVVLVGFLAVGVATSEYASTFLKVFIIALAFTSITAGIAVGYLSCLPLRRQADREAHTGRAAIIFNSGAECDARTDSHRVELGTGWLEVLDGGLALSRTEQPERHARMIPWSEIESIERSFPAGKSGYPGIAISTLHERLYLEVPRQSGLTLAGITDQEFGRIVTDLRAANPRDKSNAQKRGVTGPSLGGV